METVFERTGIQIDGPAFVFLWVGSTVGISMLLLDNIIIEIPSVKAMLGANSKN
jgi:hypothetical protein